MKTFIKTIGTVISILLITIGLTALFTIDNAQGLTGLITYAAIMILSISGGIYLLILMYPEWLDISEFDDKSLKSLEDCQQELDILREHNILLLDRYMTFKVVLKSHKFADYSDMTSYPKLYHLIYVEDLTVIEEELERFKEGYNWFYRFGNDWSCSSCRVRRRPFRLLATSNFHYINPINQFKPISSISSYYFVVLITYNLLILTKL